MFLDSPFLLSKGDALHKINTNIIIFIKAEGRYTQLHTEKGEFLTQLSLVKWRQLLPNEFTQINKSSLINTSYLDQIITKDNLVILTNTSKHTLGRKYKENLLTKFMKIV